MPYLICDHCRTVLTAAVIDTPEPVACPGCRMPLLARVFPAFFRANTAGGRTAESVASDEDASCFYHPRKKAVVPCARCGRFLCALCDLEIDGSHLCPGCLSAAPAAQAGLSSSNRLRYDKLALALTILPLLFWPLTLVAAPVALYLAIRHWNSPRQGPVPRGRWRLVVAVLFALVQIAGWAYFLGYRFVYLSVFTHS